MIRLLRRNYVVARNNSELLWGGYKWCLDFRPRAASPDGRVSAEWSRCSGSMARRPRDRVAPLQRNSAGWMLARIGRLSAGGGRRHPVTTRKTPLMVGSIRLALALRQATEGNAFLPAN